MALTPSEALQCVVLELRFEHWQPGVFTAAVVGGFLTRPRFGASEIKQRKL